MKLATAALALSAAAPAASAFQVGRRPSTIARPPPPSATSARTSVPLTTSTPPSRAFCPPIVALRAKDAADDEEEKKDEKKRGENPYADPNYPQLEFVDYSDPEYVVDQGIVGDEFFPSEAEREAIEAAEAEDEEDVEGKIEEMREERRRRNDEYQFETYHESVLKGGDEYRGEWTVYRTSTFLPGLEGGDDDAAAAVDANGLPRLVRARRDLRVVSSGRKVSVETDSEWRVDGERIVHEETLVRSSSSSSDDEEDGDEGELSSVREELEREVLSNKYWPEMLSSYDFRGHQGVMCVGNAYTICDTVPLLAEARKEGEDDDEDDRHEGPFREYRAEVGIQYKRMRMRVKLDYRALEHEGAAEESDPSSAEHPPLYLRSVAVCRETRERWPRHEEGRTDVDDAASAGLFGPAGAPGGLYDPPPVGGDVQASRYMTVDLEGSATLLFPHRMDQAPGSFDGNGWVTSLDWTPGRIRYQVDRKVMGGTKIKGLRTLELSEVMGADADEYRPRDGGANMRQ